MVWVVRGSTLIRIWFFCFYSDYFFHHSFIYTFFPTIVLEWESPGQWELSYSYLTAYHGDMNWIYLLNSKKHINLVTWLHYLSLGFILKCLPREHMYGIIYFQKVLKVCNSFLLWKYHKEGRLFNQVGKYHLD